MAPKKQQSGANAGSSVKSQSRKTRVGRESLSHPSSSSRERPGDSSCARESDMEIDEARLADSIANEDEEDEVEQDVDAESAVHTGTAEADNGLADIGHGDDEDQAEADDAMVNDEEEDEEEDEDEEGNYEDEMDDPYGDGSGSAGGFGSHIRAMAGYMSGLSGRFRTLLSSLRDRKDPTAQLVALQELSEVLSISNEDTLAGYFPTESFVGELIYLMGGPKPKAVKSPGEPSTGPDEDVDSDEALAFMTGLVDNTEMMILACRCLANLIEAMPYAAHSVVSHGAVPVLNAKLVEIEFIDLAEQVLQTLEKISREYPSAIVNNGGLAAMLQYLDFFNIHVQRTALSAAANCCRKLSPDSFDKIKEVMGIIQNVLSYSDQRLVESACRCIVRIIDSYRHHTDLLEQLLVNDVLSAVNQILLPPSQSGLNLAISKTIISPGIYTEVLKALGTAARVSPVLAVTMLENNIVETLYNLLTGSAAPTEDGEGGKGPAATSSAAETEAAQEDNAGAAIAVLGKDGAETVAMADVAVLQNLAQRPKEQVQEALSLVAELLPPLPRSGVFDQRRYTERAFNKRKAKTAKTEKEAVKNAELAGNSSVSPEVENASADGAVRREEKPSEGASRLTLGKSDRIQTEREVAKERAQARRIDTLKQRQGLVKRFTQLVLPTLVEVYAASVAWHVRSKALFGILKIVSFVEAEQLNESLDNVPLASFIAAILSSRDHAMLVQGALQLVEALTNKLPDVYSALLRREGVMWEIEDIAAHEPSHALTAKDEKAKADEQGASQPLGETLVIDASGSGQDDKRSTSLTSALPSSNLARLVASSNTLSSPGTFGGASSSLAANAQRLSSHATPSMTTISGHAMTAAEAEDSNIWRARILCEKFAPSASSASAGGADEASRALNEIKSLVAVLDDKDLDTDKANSTLCQIAELFSKPDNPVSSFELLRSGLVDGLYQFAVSSSDDLPNDVRRKVLMRALMEHQADGAKTSAAEALVRRLQETLSRLENVEISTALSGSEEGSRRSAAANVARQVRLKLIAEGAQEGEIPRSCTNIVVSIHAITSFQSLHDYLRPKIGASQALSGSSLSVSAPGSSSNLSGMLAAFASSAGLNVPESLKQRLNGASSSSGPSGRAALQADGGLAGSSGAGAGAGERETPAATLELAASANGKGENKSSRRRSSRLSAKVGETSGGATQQETSLAQDDKKPDNPTEPSEGQANKAHQAQGSSDGDLSDEALARRLMEGLLHGRMEGLDDDQAFSDEYEEDFVDDDGLTGMDGTASTGDQTIQVKIDKDEEAKPSDSTAQQEAGLTALSKSAPSTSAMTTPKPPGTPTEGGSYASALQKRPVDWHLEFEIDGKPIPLDSTIYSAIHRHEMEMRPPVNGQPHPSSRYVWSNTYTIKYYKVPGPAPEEDKDNRPLPSTSGEINHVDLPESLSAHKSWSHILQLLHVLYDLNRDWRETVQWTQVSSSQALNEAAFVNNKLTAKLNRQLEEPMIVASSCMPPWSLDIPSVFPFLFPFETRYAFLQSTAFGYHRLINRWQTQQSRNQDASGSGSASTRHDDSLAFLGRLTRQKVRISRSNILSSAFKVFELYGRTSSLLEVEYFDEVGTGLGPTLEFYAMVSKEFAKKSLHLWRSDESRESGDFVYCPNGLFPLPLPESEVDTASGNARTRAFKVLGQFVAKALYDSRIVDLNFSTPFMRAVLQGRLPNTLPMLRSVDETLAHSLEKLKEMPAEELESLSLDFTLPGQASYELHANGANDTVNPGNVNQYIAEVLDHTLSTGIKAQVHAFRAGFDLIFPTSAMSTFTPEEMALLFGNQEEDWSETTLLSSIKPDHGYNGDSATFRDVIALMSQFDTTERRDFLQWLTGSPKLPIGGFMGLHPQLTIVKRPPDSNVSADHTLPSVMTCVNFCKMPPFSSRDIMKERLLLAMREGQASFHLS